MARKVRRGVLGAEDKGTAKKMLDWRLILGLALIVYGTLPPPRFDISDWLVTGFFVSLGFHFVLRFMEKKKIMIFRSRRWMRFVIDGQWVARIAASVLLVTAVVLRIRSSY